MTTPNLDIAVLELARQGVDPEVIANRCGVTVYDVAEVLVRYAQSEKEVNDDESGPGARGR